MSARDEAIAVCQEFVDAFNSRDIERTRAVLNYPHIRLASGRVLISKVPTDYVIPYDRIVEAEGWHHSSLDQVEVIHEGPDKVHIASLFTRYHEDGTAYVSHEAIWVVTLLDGHWGLQARSSYAP